MPEGVLPLAQAEWRRIVPKLLAIGVLTKGWKAKVNQELIARTRKVLAGRALSVLYVPGHAGVAMNERADELAREAVRTGQSQPLPKLP